MGWVIDLEAELRLGRGLRAAVMKRDDAGVGGELGPRWRLGTRHEPERASIEPRGLRDVDGHQADIGLRDLHRASPFNSGSDCRSVLSSETFPVTVSGRIRFTSPVSTIPGPNSTNADAPSPYPRATEAPHCTGHHA